MPGKLSDIINLASNQLALQCATLIEDAIFISLEALGEHKKFRLADVPNSLVCTLNRQGQDSWTEYRFGDVPLFQFRVVFEKDDQGTSVHAIGKITFLVGNADEKGRERENLDPPNSVGMN